jgi:lipopolysaccharide assembly outer membrane protein LptD (OstA)
MKWISLGLLVLGSLILTAQTPNQDEQIKHMQQSMTLLDRPLGESGSLLHIPVGNVGYTADTVSVDGATVKLSGHVRIKTPTFTLTADEAEYKKDSGQIDPHGEVHIRLVVPRTNTRK